MTDQEKIFRRLLKNTPSVKANHRVDIVRIDTVLSHTNADNLEIIKVGEYQVVSRKGQFKIGDLGVYLQPDSVCPQTPPFSFIWQPYFDDRANNPALCQHVTKDGRDAVVAIDNGTNHSMCTYCQLYDPNIVPERKRRITVRRFRGEWSEGLLLPLSDFSLNELVIDPHGKCSPLLPKVGDDVSELLGITHFDPDKELDTRGANEHSPKTRKKKYPKTISGWFNFILSKLRFWKREKFDKITDDLGIPTYDVNALKNYPNTFQDGELVSITEKIHGSNARYVSIDGVMYAGSKNYWKAPDSNCVWRKALVSNPWISEWCKSHDSYVLYGEVGPTQKSFDYGHKTDDPFFFVFDVKLPNGKWADESTEEGLNVLVTLQPYWVPELYKGPFDREAAKNLATGPSTVMKAKHIREGVVVKSVIDRHVTRVGRAQMKIVSLSFLEKDNK